ncbi:MAG TPA: HAD-IIIC family phosphatase [Blastocatellia bacterium]|nr:HAD-IIIC family phosphatase [Blastocatellia bacterium]
MNVKNDAKKPLIKCVVWDLDHTLWDGVLLEGDSLALRPGVLEAITGLDRRGILQSIASKNDHDLAMARLESFGIAEYFLYPQINWKAKSASIQAIAEAINIATDSLAFIDDQAFERDEVRYAHPQVRCIDASAVGRLLEMPGMKPRFVTADSQARRKMYLSDAARKAAEADFSGAHEEFLAGLDMRLSIAPAGPEDLRRAEELTVRTHQLNTTGYTYSYEELHGFVQSDGHDLLICELQDKYGTYGKIGLALIERRPDQHLLKLLLMSCRVMSRGIGTIILNYLMARARAAGVRLLAEYVANDRNRMMYITFKFAGFRELRRNGDAVILESDLSRLQPFPAYVQVNVSQGAYGSPHDCLPSI